MWTDRKGRVIAYRKDQEQTGTSVLRYRNRARFGAAQAAWATLSKGSRQALERLSDRMSWCATGQNLLISAIMTGHLAELKSLLANQLGHIMDPDIGPLPDWVDPLLFYGLEAQAPSTSYGCEGQIKSILVPTSPPDGYGDSGHLWSSTELHGTPADQVPMPQGPNGPPRPNKNGDGALYYVSLVITRTAISTTATLDLAIGNLICAMDTFHLQQTVSEGWPAGLGSVTYAATGAHWSWSLTIDPSQNPWR